MEKQKYFFESIVKNGEEVTAQILGYDTERAAEIKFYDEVGYGLKLNTIVHAYYAVMDECGVELFSKFINNAVPNQSESEG